GVDFESAADDRVVGAPANEEKAVRVEYGAVRGAKPLELVAELLALDFEEPFLACRQDPAIVWVNDACLDIGVDPAHRPALFGPAGTKIIDCPARDGPSKFGRAIVGADRDAIF